MYGMAAWTLRFSESSSDAGDRGMVADAALVLVCCCHAGAVG